MTSVLPEEENKAARLKQKLINDGQSKEETRSFLSFSRGNLSISHSDLEQGFNKHQLQFRRNTILSTAALIIALLCLGLETWALHCSLANAREIGQLKRDVESLKHRIREEDLVDELKAFEEQLYAEESTDEEEDASEADIDNADYDSNYDDVSSSHDYSSDYHTPAYGARPSDFPDYPSTIKPVPSPPNPTPNTELLEYLSSLRKGESKHAHEKTRSEGHKSSEHGRAVHEKPYDDKSEKEKSLKHRRDIRDAGQAISRSNSKRSVSERSEEPLVTSSHRRGNRNQTRRMVVSRLKSHENTDLIEGNRTGNWDRHPPKKYYGHAHPEINHDALFSHRDGLRDQLVRTSKNLEEEALRDDREDVREHVADLQKALQQMRRGMSRRHLRTPRQVYAIHYGADSTLFSEEDEHTGNGRARHGDGVFKAWRPSDWVSEMGMNKYFALANDGKLTVHEPGLYLAYAQIHYLDEHDENGFHLLVNGRPILQCMIYSPGIGHKSRSCFSAQVTLLHAGDVLVLKDVGSARYTLFQHDKSFFGLVKLGESRQQRHPTQQPMHQ